MKGNILFLVALFAIMVSPVLAVAGVIPAWVAVVASTGVTVLTVYGGVAMEQNSTVED